jgi:hypothetical protein
VQESIWNGAACDVGEFGVSQVPLSDQELEPFDPENLHNRGLVFEPVGSYSEARAAAEHSFQEKVRQKAGLDRISQLFVRFFRRRAGLVYYPLWILRYLYRGRAFQVVVDGHNGNVLYGKAPGNTLYRAAVLVLGMAVGAFVGLDISSLILFSGGSGHDGDNTAIFGLIVAVIGFGIMYAAYRRFRYGEQYEYRSSPKPSPGGSIASIDNPLELVRNIKDVEQWINKLT